MSGRPALLTPDQAAQALALVSAGSSVTKVAALLGVSRSTVRRSMVRVLPPEPELRAEADVWPPPAGPGTVWRSERMRLGFERYEPIRLREVRLWGSTVEVDSDGAVWCIGCRETIDVRVLGLPGNSHIPGLHFGGGGFVELPLDDDDGPDAA